MKAIPKQEFIKMIETLPDSNLILLSTISDLLRVYGDDYFLNDEGWHLSYSCKDSRDIVLNNGWSDPRVIQLDRPSL